MKIRLSKVISAMLIASFAIAPAISNACTSFILKNKDGSIVYARTIEFAMDLPMKIALYPRNYQFKGTGPDGIAGSGLHWNGKYAVTGLNAYDMDLIGDGMNEKGLVGGMQYLPVSTDFQNPTGADAKNSIASYQVVNYILSNFATVDEIKAGLPKIYVNSSILDKWNAIVKMHFGFHDANGKSVVIEFIKGKINFYDNPIGAMANEPPFDWQMMNVENYLNLSPVDLGTKKIGGVNFTPRSAGSGMHGLPGDFMSQSRFLRAVEYSQAADKYAPELPRVELAWHIINMFDIPPGTILANGGKTDSKGKYFYDYTQQTVVGDQKNLTYYARFFGGSDIFKFNMKDHDWNAKERKQWSVPKTSSYKSLTN